MKIERVADKYGLDAIASDLERRWLGEGAEQMSTRALADYFNRTVLQEALDEQGTYTITGDTDQVYESLQENDGDSTLVRSRLQQQNVDIDSITDDFVTHQTVYRYLTEHRGLSRDRVDDEERKQRTLDVLNNLRGRTTTVTEQMVTSLTNCEGFTLGTISVLTDIQILCEDCRKSYTIDELIDSNGCECDD
jgi:hypothetical protein